MDRTSGKTEDIADEVPSIAQTEGSGQIPSAGTDAPTRPEPAPGSRKG